MKIFAFLLVLLSAFCAAFARYDTSNEERRSRTALLRTTTGNRNVAVSRGLKSVDTKSITITPLDDTDDDTDDDHNSDSDVDLNSDSDDEASLPDTESDFNSDIESIDGESDDDCPTGKYTLKYIPNQRFSRGNKYRRVKAKNFRSCGRACAKQPAKCNTFNWNKNKKTVPNVLFEEYWSQESEGYCWSCGLP
ncbi:hypothetical protein Ndes2526B_g07065 [Nannochloris sp. 'desiccata']